MNLQELYTAVGGDYATLSSRFGNEKMVVRFLGLFLKDPSFAELQAGIDASDWDAAFRAVHTLKGVAGNMNLTKLYEAASALTEEIRGGKPLTDASLYLALVKTYYSVTEQIKAFIAENQ